MPKGYLIHVPVFSYETYRVYDHEAGSEEEARELVRTGKAILHGSGAYNTHRRLDGVQIPWRVERKVFPFDTSIYLGKSLWSSETWTGWERCIWDRIAELEEGDAIRINTKASPNREGLVEIHRTTDGYRAKVEFRRSIDQYDYSHEERRVVEASSMAELMEAIVSFEKDWDTRK